MKIEFTPSGGTVPVTLGDDAAKHRIIVEQLGGTALVQAEALAGGANLALFARGNVGGDLIFTSSKSYASYEATFAQFLTEFGRLGQQGTVTLKENATTLTFTNAILRGVRRIFGGQNTGSHMGIQYTFSIAIIE